MYTTWMSTSRPPFPGFERIYYFTGTGSESDFIADIDIDDDVDPLAVTRGESAVAQPVRARWAMGASKPGDVIWTRLVHPILVSTSILDALSKLSCTGWSTYTVDLVGKKGEPIDGYHGLVVTGRCGPASWERGQRVMKKFPGGMKPVRRGLFFDEATWDGSDLWMPSDQKGNIFVSERARGVLARAKNVRLEPTTEVEMLEALLRI